MTSWEAAMLLILMVIGVVLLSYCAWELRVINHNLMVLTLKAVAARP